FGGAKIMPMLDLDRMLLHAFGDLGVGISAGWMRKTAKAFMDPSADPLCALPPDSKCPRSQGDEVSFNLIPLALTAIYRFTYLDDEFGIPVVPYARGGLGYYIWWSTKPDGSFSDVMGNRAAGASAGLVGSVGLSIRAERIDGGAARSMRESGI